jgi:biopolymer transport protein ExbD
VRIRTRRARRRERGVALDLASMIDLSFLLLVFFLVTTVLARPEDSLSPALRTRSESALGPGADFQPQIVEVFRHEAGGAAFRLAADVFRERAALTSALRRLHIPAGVFVRGADDAPVSGVAAAIQAARDAGFEQLTYVPQGAPGGGGRDEP